MKAYQIENPGRQAELIRQECPMPEPDVREVLIRVHSCSLNRRDLMIRDGKYPLTPRPGVIPLSDGAGEVVAIGSKVSRVKVGDRVTGTYFVRWGDGRLTAELAAEQYGCNFDGMLAEYALLREESVVPLPAHLSWEEASTLTCAGVTAWSAVSGPRPIQPGDRVVVVGTGGVGLFALQFASLCGAQVLVVTTRSQNTSRLKELGAHSVIDARSAPNWDKTIRELSSGRGVDSVIDTVGPLSLERSVRSVGMDGQIVLVGVTLGEHDSFNPAVFAGRMLTLRRIAPGGRANFLAMNRALELHQLKPVIDRTFTFEQAPAAYRYFEENQPFGKVVIGQS